MERMINNKNKKKLRRWLELPKSWSSAALYGTTNALQLPFSNLKEDFVLTRNKKSPINQRLNGQYSKSKMNTKSDWK